MPIKGNVQNFDSYTTFRSVRDVETTTTIFTYNTGAPANYNTLLQVFIDANFSKPQTPTVNSIRWQVIFAIETVIIRITGTGPYDVTVAVHVHWHWNEDVIPVYR